MDIVRFIADRLDEEALWAIEASRTRGREAVSGGVHWQWEDTETDHVIVPDPELDEYVGNGCAIALRSRETWTSQYSSGPLPQFAISHAEEVPSAVGGHIIRHDPARVLREVEAKRQIARWHGPSSKHATVWDWPEIGQWCMECGSEPCRKLNACPCCGDDDGCQTVRHLAAVYADHDDYDESWRP